MMVFDLGTVNPTLETLSKTVIILYSLSHLSIAGPPWFSIILCPGKPIFGLKVLMAKVQCSYHLKKPAFSLIVLFLFIDRKSFEERSLGNTSVSRNIFPLEGRTEVINPSQIPSGTRWQKEATERQCEEEEWACLMLVYLWSFEDFRVMMYGWRKDGYQVPLSQTVVLRLWLQSQILLNKTNDAWKWA